MENHEGLRSHDYEFFNQLYINAPMCYQSLNEDGSIMMVNTKWLETMGYNKEDVIGKSFGDFMASKSRKKFRKAFPIFLSRGNIENITFEMIRKDGSMIIARYNGISVKNENGNILRTHCIMEDITEKYSSQNKLAESEKKYKNIIEEALDGFVVTNLKGQIKEVNYSATKLTGYSEKEMLNLNISDLEVDFKLLEILAKIKNLLISGSNRMHSKLLRKDGLIIDVELTLKLANDKKNIHTFIKDVTYRKQLEIKLNSSLTELNSLFEGLPMGVLFLNSQLRIIRSNKAVEALTGKKIPDLIGKYCYDEIGEYCNSTQLHGKDRICSFCKTRDSMKNKKIETFERNFGNKIVKIIASPVINDEGIVTGVMEIMEDITRRKKVEKQMNAYKDQLEELVKERTYELEEKNKDLETKNAELLHYNELFVGREFRIKELKERIAHLED